MPASQLTLSFEPGMTARFRSLEQACAHAVYASRKGLNGVAADLDVSPTDLTKRLNNDPQRPLRVDQVERLIESTGDLTPIYYLIERFLRDPEVSRQQAISQISALVPVLTELLAQANGSSNVKSFKR